MRITAKASNSFVRQADRDSLEFLCRWPWQVAKQKFSLGIMPELVTSRNWLLICFREAINRKVREGCAKSAKKIGVRMQTSRILDCSDIRKRTIWLRSK